MTLIVAADVQDHLILAGDHCAVLSKGSNPTEQLIIRNYQKIYPWKYGAIIGSGDAILMVFFLRLFFQHECQGERLDLLRIAREAKAARIRAGSPPDECVGNIFFTLPGQDGFALHALYIDESRIELDTLRPITARFSMQEQRAPGAAACNAFTRSLKPALFFKDTHAFDIHHLELLRSFFARQSAVDDLVTASFDVVLLDKRTGIGRAWRSPDAARQLISIELEADTAGEQAVSDSARLPGGGDLQADAAVIKQFLGAPGRGGAPSR